MLFDKAIYAVSLNGDVRQYFETSIQRLQEARLDIRNKAMLEDLFKGRNPLFLRSTRKVASKLVSYCLDTYLLSADEILFEDLSRELSVFEAQRSLQLLESCAFAEVFAQDALPLRIELLEAQDRANNRLTHQFCMELCDEDSRINWSRLTNFIVACGNGSEKV